MKRLLILMVLVPFLALAACKPAATPQSKELDAIDRELDANRAKMKSLGPASDEYEKLRDRNIDLDTQRTNIMQAAARGERSGG